MRKDQLADELLGLGYLKTPVIVEAFRHIDRKDFVPEEFREEAYLVTPIPIGRGQTISGPHVVALMLEQLQPRPGEKILDIGSGSGWTTTLMAHIVGKKEGGKVIGVERVPELKEFGEKNCSKYNFVKKGIAEFVCADGSKGLAKEAPFDAIHAAAAAFSEIPNGWKEQLKINGRIIAPVGPAESAAWFGQRMRFVVRKGEAEFEERELPGAYAFVPLIEE